MGSDRSHAVVLLGVDADAGKFIYYDPVLGGENNKAAFTEIYDPRIITKSKMYSLERCSWNSIYFKPKSHGCYKNIQDSLIIYKNT